MHVIALIHQEKGTYGISFPDLPGCISADTSLQGVFQNGQEVLDLHIEGMIEDNEKLPEFRTLDEVKSDRSLDDLFKSAVLVTSLPVELPSRAVKVTITMDENLLRRLNGIAERRGFTRSGFIAEAVKQQLRNAQADSN